MTLPIFPVSPLPAGLTREPFWLTNDVDYDSGANQSLTPFVRPLYVYDIPFKNYNEYRQASLWLFFNDRRGSTYPFLMKDPYDNRVNSVLAVRSGVSAGTFFVYDINSYFTIPDTTTIGSMFSSLSGYVRLGTNYWYDQDTGVFSIVLKASTDAWGVRSMEYFKKVKFASKFQEQGIIWNQFAVGLRIREIV